MILSTVCMVTLNLLHGKGVPNIAAALRRHAAHPLEAWPPSAPIPEN